MSIFTEFDFENDVVENQKTKISSGIFSGGSGTLTSFFTSSTQQATGSFLSVYHQDPNVAQTSATAEVQFDIGYAHYAGSGSKGNTTKLTYGGRESLAMYSQFAQVVLPPTVKRFTPTGHATGSVDFYFISFMRSRMREKLDPGNWELRLGQLKLIDDSGASTNPTVNEGGRVFNVVTGSIATGAAVVKTTAANETHGALGLFYPDLGLIVLDATRIQNRAPDTGIATGRSTNTFDDNPKKLYNKIVAGSYFQVRREEEISSTNFFCRVNNKKYNFSSNPTFATGSTGDFTNPTFFKDPKVYITTVGLYNDDNELLAVAKLSKPVLKSYSREAIIKVKLDF
jgi:hypothetical protein